MESVVLKPGRDKAIRNHHHWIFSGAIQSLPAFENGSILPVQSADGDMLGHAYFNRGSSIAGRMVSFGHTAPEDAIRQNVARALELRRRFFDPAVTNACRLINAEGDFIPGLIADLYDDVLVLQIATLGMDRLKPFLVELLVESLKPKSIYEKSDLPSRREEGLADFEATLHGEQVDQVRILEEGLSFRVNITSSQKTEARQRTCGRPACPERLCLYRRVFRLRFQGRCQPGRLGGILRKCHQPGAGEF